MHTKTRAILLTFGFIAFSVAMLTWTDTAFAASCNGVSTSVIACDSVQSENSSVWGLLIAVINFLAVGVGIAVVGGIIWGGMLYASSNGNTNKSKQGVTVIVNSIIGLLLFMFTYAIIDYMVPGGFFAHEGVPQAIKPASPPKGTSGTGGSSSGTSSQPVTVADIRLRNFRDASTSTGGSVLKAGVLYRSVQLSGVNDKNAKKLSQLLGGSSGTIIDLRTAEQRAAAPDATIPDVRKVNVSTHGFLDTTPAVNNDAIRRSFGVALKSAANAKGPVLVHCVFGKDRTGWFTAMIMYASGATNKQVMTEYMKSTEAGLTVKQEWLNNGLSAARDKYGSIDGYLRRGLGLSADDIKKLRQKFGA